MSLLLTGGGCSTSLGGLVRHTGSAAALIRIPVIPETDAESQGRDFAETGSWFCVGLCCVLVRTVNQYSVSF